MPSGFPRKSGDQLSNLVRKQLHEMCRTFFSRVGAYMITHISTLLLIVVLGLPSPVVARSLNGDRYFQNPSPPQIQALATSVQKIMGKGSESDSKLPDALLADADDCHPALHLFSVRALTNPILFSLQGQISVCPRAPPVSSIFPTVKYSV